MCVRCSYDDYWRNAYGNSIKLWSEKRAYLCAAVYSSAYPSIRQLIIIAYWSTRYRNLIVYSYNQMFISINDSLLLWKKIYPCFVLNEINVFRIEIKCCFCTRKRMTMMSKVWVRNRGCRVTMRALKFIPWDWVQLTYT